MESYKIVYVYIYKHIQNMFVIAELLYRTWGRERKRVIRVLEFYY
jgi:hypothetical protein